MDRSGCHCPSAREKRCLSGQVFCTAKEDQGIHDMEGTSWKVIAAGEGRNGEMISPITALIERLVYSRGVHYKPYSTVRTPSAFSPSTPIMEEARAPCRAKP
jgi:hypothetical protein